ncbi:MAG: sigma factor, partial [Ignavibacteriaceae bacterium]
MNFNKENSELPQSQILKLDDDFSLVKRFIDGDESTFRLLVQRHKEKVRNIIYLTLGDSDSVDDIAQEVFITVYKNLKNFRFESLFTTWLYRITVNKSKDHLR